MQSEHALLAFYSNRIGSFYSNGDVVVFLVQLGYFRHLDNFLVFFYRPDNEIKECILVLS